MSLEVHIHDVGHGQAVHVFTPNGQTIVIDLGRSADFSPLYWLKSRTRRIDCLIITHPHGDHIDEIELISKLGFTVGQLYVPKSLTRDEVIKQNQGYYEEKLNVYFALAANWSNPIADNQRIGHPNVSAGMKMTVFQDTGTAPSNINNHSLVTAFEYASSKIIIPGDNEAASWKGLLQQPSFVECMTNVDVFMASHHGRENGYCLELFEKNRKPKLCVVSDGSVQVTDSTARYRYHAQGWGVRKHDEQELETRYAITTRFDGRALIRAGHNTLHPFLAVTLGHT